jgi:hypothetical protein
MPQIAVDAKGNKIRWDEAKKAWVPVERAVNGKGVEIEFDGVKWSPAKKVGSLGRDLLGPVNSLLGGFYGAAKGTMGALEKGAQYISKKTGLKSGGLFGKLEESIGQQAEFNRQRGTSGIIGDVYGGLGAAGWDVPNIAALGKFGLPIHGGLMGAAEGGVPGAIMGAAQGALAHKALGGMAGMSTPGRIATGAAFGAATTPGGVRERMSGAATMGALGVMGGKRLPQVEDRRVPVSKIRTSEQHPPSEMGEPVGDVLGIVPPGFQQAAPPSPEVAKIRSVVKKTPSKLAEAGEVIKGVIQKPGKILHKVAFEVVDRYDPFRRWDNFLVEQLRKHAGEGKTLSAKALEIAEKGMSFAESTYNMLQLRGGAGGEAQLSYRDLQRFFRRVGDMPQEFTDYMVSLRMLERANRGISNPGGITAEEALASYNKIVDSLPPARQKDFHMAAQLFTSWSNMNILKRMVDSDMLSKADAAKIMEMNHHPLPFQKFTSKEDLVRFLNDISFEKMRDGEQYVNVSGQKIFAMEGMAKDAKIQDPWEAVLERLGAVIGVAERNKAFANFVRKSQLDPTTRKMVRRVKEDTKLPPEYGSFNVLLNGKAQKWSAPIDIIESMKTLQARDIGFISGLMGKTKNAFVVGTTGLNLPFGLIKNPIRDLWTVSVTSKYGFGPGAYLSGLANSLASNFGFPTRLYNDYLRSHAAFGGFLNRAPRIQAKDLFLDKPNLFGPLAAWDKDLPRAMDKAFTVAKQVVNPISLFKGVSRSIEMAPRMGQFKKNLEGIRKQSPGMSNPDVMMKSALLARRSTVDFHRAGNFVKTANYFVPFLNARVQSVMNTLEALSSKEGIRGGKSSILGIKGDTRAVAAARVATFVVTPALAAYFYNRLHHSEEYDKVPQDTKDRYIVIMTGTYSTDPDTGRTKPEAILIPKTDAHQIFWNPAESLLEWAWANKPQDILSVATNFFSNISPVQFEKEGKPSLSRAIAGVVPPALQAPISIATNRDLYWDRPLVPGRLENIAPEEQYTSYTPETYRKIGKTFGVSPIKTQKVAESFLGGVARTPTPASIGKGLKETVFRRVGQDMSTEIYDLNKAAKSGYDTARIRAERMVKSGNVQDAREAMKLWNKRANEYAAKMAEMSGKSVYYIKRQEWFQRIYFSLDDIRNNIRRGKEKPKSAMKRQLGIK